MTQISTLALAGSDLDAYGALAGEAVWFVSPLLWTSVRGPKATDALNGLITNDVSTLAVGHAMWAAALAPKGKMVCDMVVVRESDEALLVGLMPAAREGWLSLARKYINPRLAKIADDTDRYSARLVAGPGAEHAAKQSAAKPAAATLDGLAMSYPVALRAPAWLVLHGSSAAGGDAVDGIRGSDALWQVLRVESGVPEWGRDMDENTIPQEANLDGLGAISFTKGCYTGQETVARIHFRGHVNRHLRGLRSAEGLEAGSTISDASGKAIGEVRSAVWSPTLGSIALAMLRREIEVGATVNAGHHFATVSDLPF